MDRLSMLLDYLGIRKGKPLSYIKRHLRRLAKDDCHIKIGRAYFKALEFVVGCNKKN